MINALAQTPSKSRKSPATGKAKAKPQAVKKTRKSRGLQNVLAIKRALFSPPSVQRITPSYHRARHDTIVAQLGKYYGKYAHDPVPLLGKTLLDVGCGSTPLGCMMALAGADVTAIDPNPAALQAAATDADDFGTPLTFLPVKAEALISSPQRYDVILALDVLAEHPNSLKLLWVLHQLLSPGGVLVIGHTTRNFRAWLLHIFLSQTVFRRVQGSMLRWRKFHTPEMLNALAQRTGLQPLATHLLRYSLHGMRWKHTDNRHRSTRYLNFYTTDPSTLDAPRLKKAR